MARAYHARRITVPVAPRAVRGVHPGRPHPDRIHARDRLQDRPPRAAVRIPSLGDLVAPGLQNLTFTPPHPPMGAPGATKRWTLMGSAKAFQLRAPDVA